MRFIIIMSSALLVSACATTSNDDMAAAPQAGSQSNGQSDAPIDGPRIVEQGQIERVESDDVVCRIDTPTGTRMRERICRTRAEWDAIREAGQERIRHRQSTGNQRSY